MNYIFYIIRYLIISVAMGTLLLKINYYNCKNRSAVFLLGFSLTPMVVSFADYILGIFIPGGMKILFAIIPLVLAVIILIINREMIYEKIKNTYNQLKIRMKGDKLNRLIYLMIVIPFLCVGFMSIKLMDRQIYDSDLSHYMVQAKYFANDRKSLEIDNYTNEKAGTVFADDHGPLWPVFLADSWLCTEDNSYGYWNDTVVHVAIVLCFFSFIIALIGISLAFCNNLLVAFISPAIFMISTYIDLIPCGSREAFRFIPLCALIVALDSLIVKRRITDTLCHKREDIENAVLLTFLSFFTMQGHGSSVFLIFSLLLMTIIILMIKHVRFWDIIQVCFSIAIGVFFGMIKSIILFFQTGHFRHSTTSATKGTVIDTVYSQFIQNAQSMKNAINSYGIAEWVLIIAGIISLGILIYLCIRKKNHEIFYKVLLLLSLLLPITGAFNILNYDVSTWFLVQIRYRMYLYIIISLLIGMIICYLINYKKKLAYTLILIICFFSSYNVMKNWIPNSNIDYIRQDVSSIIEASNLAEQYADEHIIIIDNALMAYYFKEQPQLVIHENSRELLLANTKQEIENAISNLDIKVFFCSPRMKQGTEEMPYYKYITDESNANKYTVISPTGNEFNIYVLK